MKLRHFLNIPFTRWAIVLYGSPFFVTLLIEQLVSAQE